MKRQASIQNFFVKKLSVNNTDDVGVGCCSDVQTIPSTSMPSTSSTEPLPTSSTEPAPASACIQVRSNKFDIGNYCQRNSICGLTKEEKISLVDNIWEPPPGYKFPITSSLNHNRSFQNKWLEEFKWLAYSEVESGCFCKYCVLFSSSETVGKGDHQMVGMLVTKPFTNWKKAREMFNKHNNYTFHKHALLTAENTKSIAQKRSESIINQINTQRRNDVLENRKRLISIIQTIRFCGRQQIALRGHSDSGRINLEEPTNNDGNFRSLLRYRANYGDDILKDNLKNSGGKSMYTSSVTQNELITTFGDLIQARIVSNVQKSVFYTVLADETTDISQIEQFSLCVRYVEEQSFKIREDFLTFVPVYDVTGEALANKILDTLSIFGLDLNKLRGQGYDGAAAMRGHLRGVQARIKEKHPLAVYTHCSSHTLNLCLSDASLIPCIRNCMGVIKEVCCFFHNSAKNTNILKTVISECCPEQKKKN